MRPRMKLNTCIYYFFSLLILVFAVTGCAAKCPADGKWSTGQTSGVINFTTSSCRVDSIDVSFDIGNGSTATQIFEPDCSSSLGKMVCKQDGMTFSGKFGSDDQASGSLTILKGLELNTGGTLEKTVNLDWSASLNK